jgi:hypothetical protein
MSELIIQRNIDKNKKRKGLYQITRDKNETKSNQIYYRIYDH